jgi:hypothetical protein
MVKMRVNDALQTKLQDVTAEKDDIEAQLASLPAKLDALPYSVSRELEPIRDNILNVGALLKQKKIATAVQVARARIALRALICEMRLAPNYEAGHQVAHIAINKKALALVLADSSTSMENVVAGAGLAFGASRLSYAGRLRRPRHEPAPLRGAILATCRQIAKGQSAAIGS